MHSIFLRIILVCVPILFTSGCVTAPERPFSNERLRDVKKVGILTLTSPNIHGRLVATTAFGNAAWEGSEPRLATAAWAFGGADEAISRPLVRLDEKRLADVRPSFKPRFLSASPQPIAPDVVRRLGKENDVQVLLVVSSSISSDFLTRTNQAMESQGLFSRRFLNRAEDYAYFVAMIEVYDTREGRRLDEIWCADGSPIGRAIVWRDAWASYFSSDQESVLGALERTTRAAVASSLARIGL